MTTIPDPEAGRPAVSIVMPTLGRPRRLECAARSVLCQKGFGQFDLEFVIVDNDPAQSARPVFDRLVEDAAFEIRYVTAGEPGIANARNAGVAAARAPLIAFLDDDEEAPPDWLRTMVDARERFGSDVVFGAIRARLPERIVEHRDYLEHFFSRRGPTEGGPIANYYGCGNSLLRTAALPHATFPFSPEKNRIGGEDDLLFLRMKEMGARFSWSPEGWVWEEATPDRLTLAYTLKRAFTYGQGPPSACAASLPPRPAGVAFWMAVGLVQTLYFGTIAVTKWAMHASDRAFAMDRAAQGIGKVFWFGPFKVAFYGHLPPPELSDATPIAAKLVAGESGTEAQGRPELRGEAR